MIAIACILPPIARQKKMNDYGQKMQARVDEAINHLDHELTGIRTGRANPALIENLPVSAYGTSSQLQQLASVQVPEARLLIVQPWDPQLIQEISKAISQSSLGINPVVDGKIIRLPFPPMTAERRDQLSQVVRAKGEEAKISVRHSREHLMKSIKTAEHDHQLSEDQAAAASREIQSVVTSSHQLIQRRVDEKVKEIATV